MATAKSVSKKRKRDSNSSEGLVFKLAAPSSSSLSPLLVSYPSLQPPTNTAFRCYAPTKAKTDSVDHGKKATDERVDDQDLLLVGESDKVEFISTKEESQRAADAGCRYIVAVHNRRTSALSILPTAKSPHILTRTVKALKSITPTSAPSALQSREAKNALGETFGTKKAKANIRARERNRVDVSAMEGVMGFVMDGIDKGAVGLPTQEEAKETLDSNRLVPPFDISATDSADVYPLHGIIPEVEWKTLSISAFEQATSDKDRQALLFFKWSKWINAHIAGKREQSQETSKGRKKTLKILLYISAMLAFRRFLQKNRKAIEKDKIHEAMSGVPSIIVDSLVSRFTEGIRDSTNHVSTSATETNLLTHVFALCLKVDNFATDTTVLAHDLSMQVSKVNDLFKSLGCKISPLAERDCTRLGLSSSALGTQRAMLKTPVVFPKPRAKRRT
ncbi:Rpa49 subunit specific to nuclear RNA polymerase I [Tricholoma matsutake]|nr:Rpa49 subunit specific to nuclear RNA polymerase I [Tricholoma matsutake 945]